MLKYRKQKNNRGFALLFSVLISSLLLSIGLSIFSVALKELSISTATRQSVYAFFAADSGREYFLYRDIKMGDLITVDQVEAGVGQASTTAFVVDDGSINPANYIVTMSKNWSDEAKTKINTYILSRGYDNENDDRVERAIEQSY